MLVRIVKMTFKPEETTNFLDMFQQKKEEIRNFEGCQLLELYQDDAAKNQFFTYSYWETPQALECYRSSDFFKETWKATKAKFCAKPEAWSVTKRVSLT